MFWETCNSKVQKNLKILRLLSFLIIFPVSTSPTPLNIAPSLQKFG